MPYVTGKPYRVWWGVGLDWTQMKFEVSALYDAADKGITFTIPYVEARAGGFPIRTSTLSGSDSVLQPADTLDTAAPVSGLYKQNDELQGHKEHADVAKQTMPKLPKELAVYIDAKDDKKKRISMLAYKCKDNVCLDPLADVPISNTIKKWDD